MELIDGKWLRGKLTGARGEKTALAQAAGLSSDKITRILSGERSIRPQEIPLFIEYFVARDQSLGVLTAGSHVVRSDIKAIEPTPRLMAISSALLGDRAVTFALAVQTLPGAALLEGDILMLDLDATPAPGDVVATSHTDLGAERSFMRLRRYLPPYFLALGGRYGFQHEIPDEDASHENAGVLKASFRPLA